mgnify:FL=1
MMGRAPDQLVGNSCNSLFPAYRRNGLFERFVKAYESYSADQIEFLFQDETINAWFEVSLERQGRKLMVNYLDISEYKCAQQTQKVQADLLGNLIDHSPSGMVLYEAIRNATGTIVDFRILLTNQANAILTGLSVEYMCSGTLLERFPWVKDEGFFHRLVQVTESGGAQKFTQHYPQLNLWADIGMCRHGDGVLFMVTNVTNLKEAELKHQKQTELLRSVMDASPTSIIVTESIRDAQNRITNFRVIMANAVAHRRLGLAEGGFIGRTIGEVLDNDPERTNRLVAVIETGIPYQFERTLPNPERRFLVTVNKWGDGFIASAADTTQLYRYQIELELSNENLRRSNENLQQFAYVASHDLQEPLRKIQSFGDILRAQYAGDLPDVGIRLVNRMQQAARRMQTLIQDLLTFSRLSSEAIKTRPVALFGLIQEVINDLELLIQEKKGRVEVGPMPRIPGDPVQLQQLFQNLISNAIKFSQTEVSPVVKISSRLLDRDEAKAAELPSPPQPYWEITVSDNGIGFEEKYLDRIFQVFQRLHSKSEYEGTGIGLAICRKVIENHRGYLAATSQPGVGSQFRIYLPASELIYETPG